MEVGGDEGWLEAAVVGLEGVVCVQVLVRVVQVAYWVAVVEALLVLLELLQVETAIYVFLGATLQT